MLFRPDGGRGEDSLAHFLLHLAESIPLVEQSRYPFLRFETKGLGFSLRVFLPFLRVNCGQGMNSQTFAA